MEVIANKHGVYPSQVSDHASLLIWGKKANANIFVLKIKGYFISESEMSVNGLCGYSSPLSIYSDRHSSKDIAMRCALDDINDFAEKNSLKKATFNDLKLRDLQGDMFYQCLN